MNEEKMKAIFQLAGIRVLAFWEVMNRYWPKDERYLQTIVSSPWWLVKTSSGLILIGWRKRVISIDWTDTGIEKIVTDDDVTKDESSVHAWSEIKAVEYLKALGIE